MTDPLTPDQLRKLLLDHVGDLEELQLLVCFHRLEAGSTMTLRQLATESRLPESSVGPALEGLTARGLVVRSGDDPPLYGFAPPDEETRAQLRRVMTAYQDDPMSVIKIMASNAIDRVRSAALRTFAEAFRLKRPK